MLPVPQQKLEIFRIFPAPGPYRRGLVLFYRQSHRNKHPVINKLLNCCHGVAAAASAEVVQRVHKVDV